MYLILTELGDSMTELAATTNIEAWAERMFRKGKSLFLVIFAQTVAAAAEPCFELLNSIRQGKLDWLPDPPPLNDWLAMYDDPQRVGNVVLDALLPVGEDGTLVRHYFDWLQGSAKEFNGMSERERRKVLESAIELLKKHWQDIQTCLRELYDLHLRQLRDDVNAVDGDSTFRRVFEKPELLFFLQVSIPCWVEYGTSSGVLIRAARTGDDDAFCKLIRVDKRVIRDPVLGDRHDSLAKRRQSVEFQDLTKAHAENPLGPLSQKNVKCALAGMIRQLSITLDQRFSPRDLRELFDAVAKDSRQARLCDEDLQPGHDAFRKMVQLEQKRWKFDEWEMF